MRKVVKYLSKMFFWCGIALFDSSEKEYGGFNHYLAGKIFKWKYTYINISITYHMGLKRSHEELWYDGYHNYIIIGFMCISYGT